MELAFSTKMLRDVCESEVLAYQMFDPEIAKSLIARLSDLSAVERISQLPIGNPNCINRNGEECVVIELVKNVMIVISANHNNNPKSSTNSVDWDKVSRIKICSIGNYDG